MNRKQFYNLTSTFIGGSIILPQFLYGLAKSPQTIISQENVIFIQLNGGNDGLNTFIPFSDPLYYQNRPVIGIAKDLVIGKNAGMGFHPSMKGFANIQQEGNLTVLQNVGYPQPNRSHFRSMEIWQTASSADEYINQGWLGRYLDLQCKDHQPTAGINIDRIDNLALKGLEPNTITIQNPAAFKVFGKTATDDDNTSNNPQLDFVRKIALTSIEGSAEIQVALKKSTDGAGYPTTGLGKNLAWIARLIKGNLNTKVYYTSLGGFDTHDNQVAKQAAQLQELSDAVWAFYNDMKNATLLSNTTLVIFSEFGRRVKDNGKGTDHGTAAPIFIVGGNNKGNIIGNNPNLSDLDNGDLRYAIDFRSVYASVLKEKLHYNPSAIGIKNNIVSGVF